jgi:hypothetical protein
MLAGMGQPNVKNSAAPQGVGWNALFGKPQF